MTFLPFLLAAAGETPAVPGDTWSDRLLAVALILAILVVGYWVSHRTSDVFHQVLARRMVDATVATFLANIAYWALIILVIIVALEKAGINTTPVTAILGASTLAIGLALRDSLANLAAGVLIIVLRYFRVGDSIEAGGVAGTVENIGMFDTDFKTADNRKITVPNGKIVGQAIINANAYQLRRIDLVFSISYDSNLRQAKDLLLSLLREDPRVLPEPAPEVLVGELAESSVNLFVRPWVKHPDYGPVKHQLLETVKLRFDAAGIVIPFPQREVRVIAPKTAPAAAAPAPAEAKP